MKRIFFIDIDGTLTFYNKESGKDEIAPNVIEDIQYAKDNGSYVVLCSGRVGKDVEGIAKELGTSPIVIANNGGVVRNFETSEVLMQAEMPYEDVKKIVDLRDKYNLDIFVNMAGKYLMDQRHDTEIKDKSTHRVVGDVGSVLADAEAQGIPVNMMGLESTDIQKLSLVRESVTGLANIYISNESKELKGYEGVNDGQYDGDYFFDLSVKGYTKDKAIKFLSEYLGIPLENCVAIGDSFNDIPMYDVCGVKVAVDNAVFELKKQADIIAPANTQGGAGVAIRQIISRDFVNGNNILPEASDIQKLA